MAGKITIKNKTEESAIIDVEGVIGVPEQWQFDEPRERVATYERFKELLEEIESLDSKRVVVNIRSTGGDVNDALLMLDALKGLNAEITTRCYGYVASAATLIAQAASEGKREVSANSLYLIHKSICTAEGNSQELSRSLDLLDKSDERIAAIYAERSGKSAELYEELMAENNGSGRWLSPQEVVEYGLADKIIESAPIASNAEQAVKNLGLPPIPERPSNLSEKMARRWKALLELLGIVESEDEENLDGVGGVDAVRDCECDCGGVAEPSEQEVGVGADSVNGAASGGVSDVTCDVACDCGGVVVPSNKKVGLGGETVEGCERCSGVEGSQGKETREKSEVYAPQKSVANYEEQLNRLKNKIAHLESKNARLSIRATETLLKEDPSTHEELRTPNEYAYMEDMRNFR